MSELPEGWEWATLGEVTRNFDGRRVPLRSSDRAKRRGPFDYYGASGVIDHVDAFLFDGDYLLIAEDGANLATRSKPIAFRASGKFWVNNHAHVVQPVHGVELAYLQHQLNLTDIQQSISGSAQPKLTQANLNRLPVALHRDATRYPCFRRLCRLRSALPFSVFRLTFVPGAQVADHCDAPDTEVWVAVDVTLRSIAHLSDNLTKRIEFLTTGVIHRRESDVPAHDVGHEVCELDAGREIAVHEERLGDDPCGSALALPSLSR